MPIIDLNSLRGESNRPATPPPDSENSRYVGGVSARGGGSGLAVEPNPDLDAITNRAEAAEDDDKPTHTITMYRNGFVVTRLGADGNSDEIGPYRSLEDEANAPFLMDLARGRTPREIEVDVGSGIDAVVSLVDKRTEEYVETFRSFTGTGGSLGSSAVATSGVVDSAASGDAPAVDSNAPMTSIQVRLLSGKRIVVKLNLSHTVGNLISTIHASGGDPGEPYVLVSGFPPAQLTNLGQSVEEAGLKGAAVTQKKC
eukprot:CAMPEP_0194324146 /NCGR_PEP_ID=MMETSP0171-20130528/26699_1 /TAXON_ID=218684 /ORGANISM="Corethron pennatum, Strain L29A3" /LENGTH=255 /DNA_ID=CAMNT_0039082971 /DNA_START=36 /DNA_END=803 /DNA_ORIENTATION=+